jgi:hypothetical protein
MTRRSPPGPVDLMLAIAAHFVQRAEAFDDQVEAAIEARADQKNIVSLMNIADDYRLKALAAARDAAPYVNPRLQAVEFSPASEATRSRFAVRVEDLTDDEVASALKAIASGGSALKLLEDATDE